MKMPYEDEPTPHECLVEPPPEVNEHARLAIGAMIAVHTELGPGQPEEAYQNALAIELAERGIKFEAQYPVLITYRGRPVARGKLDFLNCAFKIDSAHSALFALSASSLFAYVYASNSTRHDP
jgi:hypothetical protein